jgi:hypothetical protein
MGWVQSTHGRDEIDIRNLSRDHLGVLVIAEMIILKWISHKYGVSLWTG